MNRPRRRPGAGFTLLEVVITLVVAAILMSLIVPYLGSMLTKSGYPLIQLKNSLATFKVMENMTADYLKQQSAGSLDLTSMRTAFGAEGTDQNNAYGGYNVVTNRFIRFNASGKEIAAGSNQDILKVTVRPVGGGATYTTLFTRDLP